MNKFILLLLLLLIYNIFYYIYYVKYLDISIYNKILFIFIDNLHLILIITFIYLLFNFNCNIIKLLLLNIGYLITILCFMIYKRCILNIIQHKIGNIDKDSNLEDPKTKLFRYLINNGNISKSDLEIDHMDEWISFSIPQIVLIVSINLYTLVKIIYDKNKFNY